MARYRITEPSYLNQRLLREGDEIEVADSVVPGPHMQPRDASAHRAAKLAGSRMVRVDLIDGLTRD